ncbi:hypothetical protein HK100_003163 [Physocladia obscura]|uniref:Altered inheritance of mitochondria protein 24, mitochondrial n=1 Tax=Physocladia obscura TaxID=109957 RepID=A0AAD5SVX1_9FUNG|nr:hypothetical protein HK100_003163 [Physocladia obscura]
MAAKVEQGLGQQQQPQYGQNPQYGQQGSYGQQQQFGQPQQFSQQQPYGQPPPPAQTGSASLAPVQGLHGGSTQLAEYEANTFGANLPSAETHNPKGIIQCGDVKIKIEGDLVPVVDVLLGGQMPIFFEHHILLWKTPEVGIQIRLNTGTGGLQRLPGNISFSRDSVGQIVALRLAPGQTIEVREHQFLLATANCNYSVTMFPGVSTMLFGKTGLFIDTFTAQQQEGLVLLHGYGNVFEKTLAPGEALDVEPGAWLWKDPTVQIQTVSVGASNGPQQGGGFGKIVGMLASNMAGAGFRLNRFIGPGRIGLQSMTYHPPQAEGESKHQSSNAGLMSSFAQF